MLHRVETFTFRAFRTNILLYRQHSQWIHSIFPIECTPPHSPLVKGGGRALKKAMGARFQKLRGALTIKGGDEFSEEHGGAKFSK